MSYETIEQFAKEIQSKIRDFLPNMEENEYDIRIFNNLKNNDLVLTGLVIGKENETIAPTIYLEPFYERWKNGGYMSMRSVLQDIVHTYEDAVPPALNVQDIQDFETVKDKITRQLINFESNQALLENVPYKQYENLAIVYRIEIESDEHRLSSILLSNNLFKQYGVSLEELDVIAKENTKHLHPPVIAPLAEIHFSLEKYTIMETFEVDEKEAWEIFTSTYGEANNALVVRNQNSLHGAIHILDEMVMDEIGEQLGEKFVVIPSSVNDVIVMPFEGDYREYSLYEDLIEDVNTNNLPKTEYLSSNVYLVDVKEHILLRMDRAEEYFKEQEKKQEEQKEMIQEETDKMIPEAQIKRQRLP